MRSTAPACAASCSSAGRSGRYRLAVRRRVGSAHPSLSCPRLGQEGGGSARSSAGAVHKAGDARRLDWARRDLMVHTSPTKRSSDFIAFSTTSTRYGPSPAVAQADRARPRQRPDPYQQGLAGRACRARYWLTIEWLPKYAPELNDIEEVLARSETPSSRASDLHRSGRPRPRIHEAVINLNTERNRDPLANQRIAA